MAEGPVFYDPSGRRRRRFALAVGAFVLLVLLAIGLFFASIGLVARAPLLPVDSERAAFRKLPPPHEGFLKQTGRGIAYYTRELFGGSPAKPAAANPNGKLAIAFHVPWDPDSAASLRRHVEELDWVIPGWVSVTGANHVITSFRDPAGKAILNRAQHRPVIVPMIQNAIQGVWDPRGIAALLHDPRLRAQLLDKLEPYLAANQAGGAFFDFEELTPAARRDYLTFLGEAHARFAKRGWVVAIAAPVGTDSDWNIAAFARVVDRVFLMAYDEHELSGEPGPIASNRWFVQSVAQAARGVPRDKLVVAIGGYAYDWHGKGGDPMSVEEAWLAASQSGATVSFDRASGNSSFAYDEDGERHTIWLLDAASAYNELKYLQNGGFGAVALWRLGSEDPSFWSVFGRDQRLLPPPSVLDRLPAGNNVDIEGPGEILKIASVPVEGQRVIGANAAGFIADVAFPQLPTPYTVQRFGARPGYVALTFDDGPDAHWTPQILDILKREHVPATFFIVGENALTNRGLLLREVNEGHEVGSHTYTHPNLANSSQREVMFELNTTQRLFQAFTGRSLRLFRAPYFGDAEPSTADEILPALEAQERGYLSVGLHVDSEDWQRPGPQAIISNVVPQVLAGATHPDPTKSYNIVLLHDAGGDRAQTVAALPGLIEQLKAQGIKFVPVSELARISRDQAMPAIANSDRLAAQVDLGLFSLLGWSVIALGWLFTFAITIGIVRALALSALALWQARRESREIFPPIDPNRFVTVMIPAFNEEAVIERSVARVLASTDVQLEVIVIDDGSKDRTSEIVREVYANEPRVRLLTLENGGKARALNKGLELAKGEIVIALDADTQFEPTTIARLLRWFGDPRLGAVAGNAKVGNRVNLVTKWQALEYVTAQNLERRALARLNAITVVPGAVGAWRLSAIREVGGYPDDTLAEDQDLTIAIQRAGWKVRYDQYAVAWTEAPETFRALAKQRFRWAYGTLQCLWKHGGLLFRAHPAGLGFIGLPQAIVFQVLLAAISPIIDLALIVSFVTTYMAARAHGWAATQHDVEKMLTYWLIFTAIDLLSAFIAFALERREKWSLLWLLIPQRVGYRQVMYYVVLKAITQALRGPLVGWGKLARTGRVGA